MIGTAQNALPRRGGFPLIPPPLSLAVSRLRRTWRLLLITELGLLGAVLLICAVPLFSRVAVSSGLRAALAGSPGGPHAKRQPLREQSHARSGAPVRLAYRIQDEIGSYLAGKPTFSA